MFEVCLTGRSGAAVVHPTAEAARCHQAGPPLVAMGGSLRQRAAMIMAP